MVIGVLFKNKNRNIQARFESLFSIYIHFSERYIYYNISELEEHYRILILIKSIYHKINYSDTKLLENIEDSSPILRPDNDPEDDKKIEREVIVDSISSQDIMDS
ncbi:unnamed protein product [Cunninghamella echinulata]